jgi:hypothetical protein
MGCAFVVRPGQERRGLADTLTLFPRQSTRERLLSNVFQPSTWTNSYGVEGVGGVVNFALTV